MYQIKRGDEVIFHDHELSEMIDKFFATLTYSGREKSQMVAESTVVALNKLAARLKINLTITKE